MSVLVHEVKNRATDAVKKIGIEKIAESAGTTARKVNRFVTDPTTSKNSDILKIKRAVEELSNEGKS